MEAIIDEIKRNKFWFIDIPRTSSSSIKVELMRNYGSIYGKTGLMDKKLIDIKEKAIYLPPHIPAMYMKKKITEEVWDNLFTFSIVRNPWDRTVSIFNYRKKINTIPKQITFKEYVVQLYDSSGWGKENSIFHYHGFYLGSADYLLDFDNSIIVKFIGKYEDRTEFIEKIRNKLNIPDFGKLHTQKAGEKKHYSSYYDEQTKCMIEELYSNDIKLFDYSFHRV